MHSKIKVTVIVPVYNVEQYLEKCIDSILKQSYPVAEVLLVDDGSTDGSGELCERMSATHDVLKVIHKRNAGLGFARNTGLDNVSKDSTHVMFVDSDDWLEQGMIERLADELTDAEADCVVAGYTKRDNAGKSFFKLELEDAIWEGGELTQLLLPRICGSAPCKSDSIPMSACSTLYTKANIDEGPIRFPSEREVISEDFVFKYKYLSSCKRVRTSSCVGYSYRANNASLSTSYRPDRFEACMSFYDYARKLVSGSTGEDECLLRLKKTLFIYMKTCISQEVRRVSGKSTKEACAAIRQMISDERLLQIIEEYPRGELGIKQQLYLGLLKRGMTNTLYAAAKLRVF